MNLKPYMKLLEAMTLVNFNFGRKTGELCQDPGVFEEIFQGVKDGSIDPGDSEDATSRMMQFLRQMQEYEDLMEFYRMNRKELAELNLELSAASAADYIEYTETLQHIAIEKAVEQVFGFLREKGIIQDNR